MLPLIAMALAPLLKDLAANGLSLIGNAVLAKGKDVIEEKLGVKLDDAMQTDEGRQKLLQLQTDHEEFLLTNALQAKELDFKFYEADLADTQDARDMNAKIQESSEASWNAKNAAYVLDYIIVASTIFLGFLLFLKKIPEDNVQIANIMFGSLFTLCGTVVNFHRGSSKNSQNKDETIKALSEGSTK